MGLFDRFKSMLSGGKVDVDRRYEKLREAISGTMSKFYKARDRETGKIVGLKVLDPQQTAAFEGRFKGLNKPSEGEIALQFDHPRLMKTYEAGLTTQGEQYLVVEYVDGEGMNSLIVARDPALDGRRLLLMRQAAEAIAAVHAAGFIHRDVCPRNFIVSPRLDAVKLIDFGLTVPNTPPFRQAGNRTGTPKYMAPEVVRRRPTDVRLDVFSYGVSMYELCAFQNPWSGGVTGQDAMTHGTEPPTDIRTLLPDIHPELAALLHDCLAAAPDRRPASMAAVLERLAAIPQERGR